MQCFVLLDFASCAKIPSLYCVLCYWRNVSTPEQAQGVSLRKVSVVVLSSSSPCAFCVCACMQDTALHTHLPRKAEASSSALHIHAWACGWWHGPHMFVVSTALSKARQSSLVSPDLPQAAFSGLCAAAALRAPALLWVLGFCWWFH